MDHDWARQFCESWVAAWNAHDLERVLSHFSDDIVFSSAVAAQLSTKVTE
jgi:ketosteroid isomerase-like protein